MTLDWVKEGRKIQLDECVFGVGVGWVRGRMPVMQFKLRPVTINR